MSAAEPYATVARVPIGGVAAFQTIFSALGFGVYLWQLLEAERRYQLYLEARRRGLLRTYNKLARATGRPLLRPVAPSRTYIRKVGESARLTLGALAPQEPPPA